LSSKDKNSTTATYLEELKKSQQDGITGFNFGAVLDQTIQTEDAIKKIDLGKLIKAPKEWNFYAKLNDDKMKELLESILNNGLLYAIIVWKQLDGKYMILAGHNRVEAFTMIALHLGLEEYKEIPAIIYEFDDLDENKARQIIIDTNWVQRELSAIEKSTSIVQKYELISNDKTLVQGKRVREVLAEEFNISGRQVQNYYALNNLISPFKNFVQEGRLSIKVGAKVSVFSEETQQWMYDEFGQLLNNKVLMHVKTDMTRSELEEIFAPKNTIIKKVIKVDVSEENYKEYKALLKEWAREKGFDITIH